MTRYIYQLPDWPNFFWDHVKLSTLLAHIHQRQGHIMGTMRVLGFSVQNEAALNMLTLDVIKSSEIEGEVLNEAQVRSSVARRLGIHLEKYTQTTRQVEGVVEMMVDATQHFNEPLTDERLFNWHIALLGSERSLRNAYLKIGVWRDDLTGPMQVVSGSIGRERVHFEAPPASCLESEMKIFIDWVNHKHDDLDPIIKAAIAHFWFVTLHPFDDGNGRIARAITDWLLARHEQRAERFYSLSAQIRQERKTYYEILESTSKGTLDITLYLEWFLHCLDRAFDKTEQIIEAVLFKTKFWEDHANTTLNDRQKFILNKLIDGFTGKLTSTKWAKLTKCSQDTALRDIQALIVLGILVKEPSGGRSTSYTLLPLNRSQLIY